MGKEKERELEDIKEMKENLVSWVKIHGKNCCEMNSPEEIEILGEVVDMIKDLACAYKDCMEAKYYEEIVEAMKEGEKEWNEESYGYNHNHYSSGRFAPKGHGHYSGYESNIDQLPYVHSFINDPDFEQKMHMGYGNGGDGRGNSGGNMNSSGSSSSTNGSGSMGYDFDNYRMAKRNYTNSHDMNDKIEMDKHGKKAFDKALDTVEEIYKGSDPKLQKELKDKLTNLVQQIPTA